MVELGFKCVTFNHPNKTISSVTELGLLLVIGYNSEFSKYLSLKKK